jgi:hypothetical protein
MWRPDRNLFESRARVAQPSAPPRPQLALPWVVHVPRGRWAPMSFRPPPRRVAPRRRT